MTDRDKYHADQKALHAERAGRTEHVVSVMPMTYVTGEKVRYRAFCTCSWRSDRFSTMLRGERAALLHRQSFQASISAPLEPGTTTESGGCL
jgi:hypothetical protein